MDIVTHAMTGAAATAPSEGRLVCRDLRTRDFCADSDWLVLDVRGSEPRVERFDG